MQPIKETLRFYIEEEGKVALTLKLRDLLNVEIGDEVNLFFDFEEKLICIEKAVPSCLYCGTSEEKVVEVFKDLPLCKKCIEDFLSKNFGE